MIDFVISGSTECSYGLIYKTAGTDGIFGVPVHMQEVYPGVTYPLNLFDRQYINFDYSLNDEGCGSQSSIEGIELSYNIGEPTIPNLLLPANGNSEVDFSPEFSLGSFDADLDYIRYRMQICSDSNCSSVVYTADQTVSQAGWITQSAESGTAYQGGEVLPDGVPVTSQYALYRQPVPLAPATQYWWRAQAIDPAGLNQWSDYSSAWSFTTSSSIGSYMTKSASPNSINTYGNTNVYGNTTFTTGN
jgi:hypothetical protein